jgi:hypothetical protein
MGQFSVEKPVAPGQFSVEINRLSDSHGYQPALPAAPEDRMRQVSAAASPAD